MNRRILPRLIYFLVAIGFFTCKKADVTNVPNTSTIAEKFFSVPLSASIEAKAIASNISFQNDKKNFVEELVKRVGYPKWDKAKIIDFENGTTSGRDATMSVGKVAYVPFIKDSVNYINSILAVKLTPGDTAFKMIYSRKYKEFGYDTTDKKKWNSRDIFNLFVSFEYSIFGHTRFLIKDTKIFSNKSNSQQSIATLMNPEVLNARMNYMSVTCFSWKVCEEEEYLARQTIVPVNCITYQTCTYYDDNNGGTGWTKTGDGGNGGWYNENDNPCPVNAVRITIMHPIGECDPGWVPIDDDTFFDPVFLEDQWYTTTNYPGKADGFPWKWWENDSWLSNPNNFNLDIDAVNAQYDELTAAEKNLVKTYPGAADLIRKNIQKAVTQSVLKFGTDGPQAGTNDKQDAFRHAYFQAINLLSIKSNTLWSISSSAYVVRQFAIAHESEVPSQLAKEKEMDLFNNEVGINVVLVDAQYNTALVDDAVMTKIQNGNLRYLKPLNYNDPHWHIGPDGTRRTATNGITAATVLTPTNQ